MKFKNQKCLGLVLVFIAFIYSNSGAASDVLEMNQAISEGLGKSPGVQKSEAAAQESSWHKTGGLSEFLPSLTMNANHFFATQYQFLNVTLSGTPVRFPLIYAQTTLDFNVKFPIFDGLQNVRRYRAGSLQSDAAESEASWTRFKAEQDIRLKYVQALGAEKLEEVAQHNLKTLNDHLEQIRLLKKGGISTNYDVLRVEVQVNEAQSEALQAEDNRILARQRLSLVMGIPDDTRVLQGELPIPDSSQVIPLEIAVAQASRADLNALQGRVQASYEMESAASAFWVPRVSLGADYMLYNNRNFGMNSSDFDAAYNVGLFVSWSVFDGMSSIARSKEAIYQAVQAEKQLDQLKLQVPYDFNFWKRRCLYSANLYSAKTSDVAKAQESVRLSRDGYKAGARTNTEVLDAEFDLFRARAGVVNSQLNYSEALINLELALGKKTSSKSLK
jgi:outer membrane protein TolC